MVGWDVPFDESMLDQRKVIIFCPDEELANELFEVLKANGIRWFSGESMDHTYWRNQGDGTCYRIMETGSLRRGSIDLYEDEDYDDYVRCQFYGVESPNDISDSEFEAIISAGGSR